MKRNKMFEDLYTTIIEGNKLGYDKELFRHLVNTAFYDYMKHLTDDPADYADASYDMFKIFKKASAWNNFNVPEAIGIIKTIGNNKDVGDLMIADLSKNLPKWAGANVKESQKELDRMKKLSSKLPDKTLKLEAEDEAEQYLNFLLLNVGLRPGYEVANEPFRYVTERD